MQVRGYKARRFQIQCLASYLIILHSSKLRWAVVQVIVPDLIPSSPTSPQNIVSRAHGIIEVPLNAVRAGGGGGGGCGGGLGGEEATSTEIALISGA